MEAAQKNMAGAAQQDSRRAFSITISITVGILSGVVAGFFVFAFWMWPAQREIVKFAAACFGGAAAVTAAVYAGRQLELSARQQKERLEETRRRAEEARQLAALTFVERWNSPLMHHVKLTVRDLLREKRKNPQLDIEKQLEDPTKSANVGDVLNFFEEMATAIQLKVADDETARSFFRGILVTYYDALAGWIEKRRSERSNPRFFKEFEWLWNRWKAL